MRNIKKWILVILVFIIMISLYQSFFNTTEMFGGFDENEINCYVITMGDEKRLENIKNNQAKLNFTINIFDAVNGSEINLNDVTDPIIDDGYKPSDDNKIRKREIGCYLSHYNIYKKIESDTQTGYTIIFEDDFLINDDKFEEQIVNSLKDLETHDFDILYIYNHTDNIGEPVKHNICKTDKNKVLWGTSAYIVKNKNINNILNETKILNMPIDWRLQESIKEDKLTAFTFCPFLSTTSGIESTIQVQ